jgi:hypothetical protein
MARLILTFGYAVAKPFMRTGVADCVIEFRCNFAWGKLHSSERLKMLLSQRPEKRVFEHWTEGLEGWSLTDAEMRGLGLIEFCEGFDAIELWANSEPETQLQLIWLLDHLRPHANVASRLSLVQTDTWDSEGRPEDWIAQRPHALSIHADHLSLATAAWEAWRAPAPVAWFELLSRDLRPLPQLRNTTIALLEELPSRTTGLGATEMQMLARLAAGYTRPYDLIPRHDRPNDRVTYGLWEAGALLDGLARCAHPAVSGLTEGPFDRELHVSEERLARYENSTLSLTDLGKAILAGEDDFSDHNPIHRWWGGTELTNDRLWRWDPTNRRLVAP